MRTRILLRLALAGFALSTTSCNVFDAIDNPSGEAQLLSSARACFDRGDYACAADHYSKLGGDTAVYEGLLMRLDQAGAGFGDFLASFGTGGGIGAGASGLARRMLPAVTAARRLELFRIVTSASAIGNASQRAFIQFIGSTAVIAGALAEAGGGDGVINTLDVAAADCVSGCTTCTGGNLGNNAANASLETLTEAAYTAASAMTAIVDAGILADTAIRAIGGSGSGTAGSISTLSQVLPSGVATAAARCELFKLGFGQ